MVFIRTIPPEDATGKLKELYDEGYKNTGSYPPAVAALSMRPDVITAWRNLDATIKSTMSSRNYELATVSATVALQCSL